MAEHMSLDTRLVKLSEVERFVKECMLKVGAPEEHASVMADLLILADRRGHISHGLNRLERYIDDIQRGVCDVGATPCVLQEKAATAWVDGRNALGPIVSRFCMQLAIRKASETGIGWVVAKGSNHYGIGAWTSMIALKEKMIGMALTNTSPLLSPTRSKVAALGTNPITVAAPAGPGEAFDLDIATAAVCMGKIEVLRRRGEPIPHGWAQDANGAPTTDAEEAVRVGCLMPLGGEEAMSGYKGYGLSLMVEVFCGVLGGAACGPDIRKWHAENTRPADLGQCFVAIDPKFFAPGFESRLQDLMDKLRAMEPANKEAPVIAPGDTERAHAKTVEELGGVLYDICILECCEKLAKRLGVRPIMGCCICK